jgi:hypothetical protein
MRSCAITALAAALLLPAPGAVACAQGPAPRAGDEYEIVVRYETSERGSDGFEGTAHGSDALLERVLAVRADGVELEYDLPGDATAEQRAAVWQFPARVLQPAGGAMLLLNGAELEARVDRWLAAAGWTRAVCGRWIFTWNAFRIECDPQSVLATIGALDLRSVDLREEALYRDSGARAPGALARLQDGGAGARFRVVLAVDPDAVRRERAQSDVATGEIMQTPVTLEEALRRRAQERVTGTIEFLFETDSEGRVLKRTRVARVVIEVPGGRSETRTATQTVERRRLPDRATP